MTRLILAVVLALAVAGEAGAVRTIEYTEGSYEVTLADLVLPNSASGRLSVVRTCTRCGMINLTVSANTEYTFGAAKGISLAEFRTAAAQQRQRPGGAAAGVVFYNFATKRVTRVILKPLN